MTTLTIEDEVRWQLDPNQTAVADGYLRNLARIMCLMGARGGGKSAVLRAIIVMAHIMKRRQFLYASQSNGNSLDQFNKVVTNETAQEYFLRDSHTEPYTTKPIPTIRWANGGETLFWSLENQRSKRGLHPDDLIVDEAQSISKTAWSKIIYPMRIRLGRPAARILIAGSCPDSEGHWFWQHYERGLCENDGGIKSYTMDVNSSVAFKGPNGRLVLAEARANMAVEDYESEFLLKPGGQGDYYFNRQNIDACVAAYNHAPADLANGTILTYDPSLGTKDPAAYAIMDLRGNIILCQSISKTLTDEGQVEEVIEAAKKYKSLVVVESNSTAYMTYTGAMRKLLPYGLKEVPLRAVSTRSGEAKVLLCRQFAWQLEHRTVRINPACKTLVAQLKGIRDYKTAGGMLAIRAPDGQHDDEAFCAVIAGEALAKGWRPNLSGGDGNCVSANFLL
jgi:hypothetical protein